MILLVIINDKIFYIFVEIKKLQSEYTEKRL